MPLPLLQPGLLGGPELLMILLLGAVYLVLPVLLIVVVYNFLDGKRGYQQRIADLERRDADGDRARAEIDNGVLEIELPKTGEDDGKPIPIDDAAT